MEQPFKNQEEYLASVMEVVLLRMGTLTEADDQEDPGQAAQAAAQSLAAHRERCVATLEGGTALPLEYLYSAFGMTDFERHCLAVSLAAELDGQYAAYFASMQGGKLRLPALDLCLRSFTPDQEERLALLAKWHGRASWLDYIFASGHRDSEQETGLKLHPRLVDFILDCELTDPQLADMLSESWDEAPLPELVLRGDQLEELERFMAGADPDKPVLCFLQGEDGSGRRTLTRHLCKKLDVPLLTLDLRSLLQREEPWDHQLLTVLRETRLRGAALALVGAEELLEDEESTRNEEGDTAPATGWSGGEQIRQLLDRAAETVRLLFLISRKPWRPEIHCEGWQRAMLVLDTPDAEGRLQLWTSMTAGLPLEETISLDGLANKFALEPGQIAGAVQEAQRLRRWQGEEQITSRTLHQACRSRLSHDLSRLASRVESRYTWDDLIMEPEQKQRLRQACDQVEFRRKVYEQWGFGKKVAYGRGVSMLFSGPPGTGKTMAAQVIANRLGLELYKVDLSGVMSKYIGETEKQLGAVFDEVKKSQSILFFDEADALFGKRSETKDSHDRYANVQTSYLLQKIEDYDGIVILASNFLQNFDEAFKRRIKFVIDFTLPDRERREQLWRSVMPPELPRSEDIDFDFLARSFELSGSSIKNIVIAAAFLSASDGIPLSMVHLLTATQAEQHKAGKTMGRDEFGEYYQQVVSYQHRNMR